MKNCFILILFLGLYSAIPAQLFVDTWKSYSTPSPDSALSYNGSDTSWFVTLNKDGRVTAENKIANWPSPDRLPFKTQVDTNPPFKKRGFQTVKKIGNGYLVGYNRGEWGGDLFWYSAKGDSGYRIVGANVVAIEEFKNKLLIIEGLAHLNNTRGSINKLELKNNKWQIVKKWRLPSAPELCIYYKNKLLIIASDDILTFDGHEKIEIIRKDGFWDILYPQSAVIIEDMLYVGMRKGVFKLNLKTMKEEWLMPQ